MRAPEHDGVDASVEVREIPLGDRLDRRSLAPALFRESDKNLACDLGDVGAGFQCLDRALMMLERAAEDLKRLTERPQLR